MRQFVKKGSQFGPRDYWGQLTSLFKVTPSEVIPSNAADAIEFLNALQNGIVKKDEPKHNLEAAFDAYLDITSLVIKNLPAEDKGKVLEELVIPILQQYLHPSADASQWNIPLNATGLISKAVCIDGMEIVLGNRWLRYAQDLVDAIKTSAPEQSKDYEKSQSAVTQHGTRYAIAQSLILEAKTLESLQSTLAQSSASVVSEALNAVKNRNGKPYGAAAVVTAMAAKNKSLISSPEIQQQLTNFVREDIPDLIVSPSSTYLIDLLYSLSDNPVFKDAWSNALKTLLKDTESPARTKALEAILTSSKIPPAFDLASSDAELQKFAKETVTRAVEGSLEWDSFSRLLQSQAKILAPDTTEDILVYLTESLSISDRASSSLQGLRHIVKSNPSILKDFVATPQGSTLLQTLLLASESPSDDIAHDAAAVNSSLQTILSSGSESKQSIYGLIHQGLQTATQTSVSVETLVDLAKQSVKAGDSWEVLQQVFPSVEDWNTALLPFLSVPPKTSLAITNALGGAVYLIDGQQPSSEIKRMSRDADGYSAAYRITQYVSRLFKTSELFPIDKIPSDVRTSYLVNIALVVQLAQDNLGLAGANGLWVDYNADVESEVMLFMSDAQAFLTAGLKHVSSTWANGATDTILAWASGLLGQMESTASPQAYYHARAFSVLISDVIDIVGWKTSHTTQLQDILKTMRRDKNAGVFHLLSLLNAFKEPLSASKSCERICNELVADLTGLDIEQKPADGLRQLVQLNSLLYGQAGIEESIAKQRLVFFVKHVIPWLNLGDDARYLKAELCRALTVMLPMMSDMYGEHWSEILSSLATAWSATKELEENESGMDSPIPFVHASLKLYALLRSLTQLEDPNDDLIDAWKETEQPVANGLINLLKHSQHFPDEFHQPLKMVNDVLARQIAKVSLQHLESTEELYPLLYVESQPVQQTAFDILHKQIPASQEQISIDAALEKSTARLPEELLSLIIDAPTVSALAEANLERSVPLPLRGYLLSWLLIFDHLEHSSFKVKNDYVDHLKEGDYLPGLLNFTFDLLGHAHNKPVDVSKFDITTYEPDMEPPKRDLQWLLTHLYFLCLKHVPSLTKAWFIDCKSRATQVTLEPWTEKHVSTIFSPNFNCSCKENLYLTAWPCRSIS